ncbi:unnamed protein product [Urochloa decumbens]|uniref:F-box domain-containing protein n=1 Tax=Urochloa decumbens TaxID=240449 RepID=A0ABC9B8N3_9POAL
MLPGESSRTVVPPAAGSGGSLDALPDCILEHIIGFLHSPEAVRTSVVAHRWRHLWRSAPSLRVGCSGNGARPPPINELREFVDRQLLLREGSPLDTCDIRLGEFQRHDFPLLNSWVQQAISCKAKVPRLYMRGSWYLVLDNVPVVSKYLTRLELYGVSVHTRFLDISSCPALEYLQEQDTSDCLCRLSANSCGEGVNSCVLFNGLSKAKSLELICSPSHKCIASYP